MMRVRALALALFAAFLLAVQPAAGEAFPATPEWIANAPAPGSGWTWEHPLPQGNSLNDVWGSGPGDVFAVGEAGVILHYDGSEWTQMESGTTAHLYGVWGSSAGNIYAAGWNISLHYDGSG